MTDATRRVLSLAAAGLSSAQIADRLGCSRSEVLEQFRVAITTLGARSKLEAVILALQRGEIELPPQ